MSRINFIHLFIFMNTNPRESGVFYTLIFTNTYLTLIYQYHYYT
uniref:Uncharacterized protein n=1 Tax=Mammaliicoccus phage MSShimriz1 TaxID=3230127 RepID=A0AAU8GRK8_9VIRU